MRLEGSCECGGIRFSAASRAPYPYRVCYCRRCRKFAGAAGAALNVLADSDSLDVHGDLSPTAYRQGTMGR